MKRLLLLAAFSVGSACAALDIPYTDQWDVDLADPQVHNMTIYRGETRYLQPRYLTNGVAANLTGVSTVQLWYKPTALSTAAWMYVTNGTVSSPSAGRVQVTWTTNAESQYAQYDYNIFVNTAAGASLSARGKINLAGTVAGTSTNAPGMVVMVEAPGTVLRFPTNGWPNGYILDSVNGGTNLYSRPNTVTATATNVNYSDLIGQPSGSAAMVDYMTASTQGFVTATVTNGLAPVSYVDSATQSLVTATITNGLAPIASVIAATQNLVTATVTNGLAPVSYVDAATQSFITASVTNGLAPVSYVVSATQQLKAVTMPAFTSAWKIVYSDSATSKVELAMGAPSSYLKSGGLLAAPSWSAVTATATNVALADLIGTMTNAYMPMGDGTDLILRDPGYIRTNLSLAPGVNVMAYGTNFVYDTNLLSKILLVDGSGSGIDADLLDGFTSASIFETINSITNGLAPASITNGLASVAYVDASTSSIAAATLTGTVSLDRLSGITSNQIDPTTDAAYRSGGSGGIDGATATQIVHDVTDAGFLATTGRIETATNSVLITATNLAYAAAKPLTNGYVTAAITNDLAPITRVVEATNSIAGSSVSGAVGSATVAATLTTGAVITNITVWDSDGYQMLTVSGGTSGKMYARRLDVTNGTLSVGGTNVVIAGQSDAFFKGTLSVTNLQIFGTLTNFGPLYLLGGGNVVTNGAAVTNLNLAGVNTNNASQIDSGTLADARIASTIARDSETAAATNGIDAAFLASKGGVTNGATGVILSGTLTPTNSLTVTNALQLGGIAAANYLTNGTPSILTAWDAPRAFVGATGTLWAFGDSQTEGINAATKPYTSGGYLLPQYRWPNMLATNFDRAMTVTNCAIGGSKISGTNFSHYNMTGHMWTNWTGVAVCMNGWNNIDSNTTTEAFYAALNGSHAAIIARMLIDDYGGITFLGAGSGGLTGPYPLYSWLTDGVNDQTTPPNNDGMSGNAFYYGDTNGARYRTSLTGTNYLSFTLTNKQAIALFLETSSDGGDYAVKLNGVTVYTNTSAYANLGGNDAGQYAQVIWLEDPPSNSAVRLDVNCGAGHVYFHAFGWVDKSGATKLKTRQIIYGTPSGNTANGRGVAILTRVGAGAENAVGAFALLGYPVKFADTFSAIRITTDQESTDISHFTDTGNYHIRDAFERSATVGGYLDNVIRVRTVIADARFTTTSGYALDVNGSALVRTNLTVSGVCTSDVLGCRAFDLNGTNAVRAAQNGASMPAGGLVVTGGVLSAGNPIYYSGGEPSGTVTGYVAAAPSGPSASYPQSIQFSYDGGGGIIETGKWAGVWRPYAYSIRYCSALACTTNAGTKFDLQTNGVSLLGTALVGLWSTADSQTNGVSTNGWSYTVIASNTWLRCNILANTNATQACLALGVMPQ